MGKISRSSYVLNERRPEGQEHEEENYRESAREIIDEPEQRESLTDRLSRRIREGGETLVRGTKTVVKSGGEFRASQTGRSGAGTHVLSAFRSLAGKRKRNPFALGDLPDPDPFGGSEAPRRQVQYVSKSRRKKPRRFKYVKPEQRDDTADLLF